MMFAPRTHVSFVPALALGALAACDSSLEMIGENVYADSCPVWECGGNAGTANDLPIGENHLFPGLNTGEVSAWGAQIIDFTAPPSAPGGADSYTLRVENGRFLASNGMTTLAGDALRDSVITMLDVNTNNTIHVHFHDHDTMPSWTTNSFPVDRYILTWFDPNLQEQVPVCTDAADPSAESAWAVVLSNERYSWTQKAVTATGMAANGWFNIVCKGNALYDMKLMGYDPRPAQGTPYTTTAMQRQAALKMITADYCGGGESFTETGTPLRWFNQAGWSDNGQGAQATFEAKWGHTGAVCLDQPRLAQLADIEAECASLGKTLPPPCTGFSGSYEWSTENPAPPAP